MNLEPPLISIVTVVYNTANSLEATILSVINQTYKNIEYIIIDGSSTDGTLDIIKKYESRLSYWVSEPDQGIYDAMNKGITIATGEWVNFMNSGDIFANSDVLSTIFSQSEITEDIICGITKTKIHTYKPLNTNQITPFFLFKFGFCHQSAFIREQLLKQFPYDTEYRIAADKKFFIQVLLISHCSYRPLNIPICYYDINGISGQNKELVAMETYKIFAELSPNFAIQDFKLFEKMYNKWYLIFVSFIDNKYVNSLLGMANRVRRFLLLIKNKVDL